MRIRWVTAQANPLRLARRSEPPQLPTEPTWIHVPENENADPPSTGLKARLARVTGSPWFRWTERVITVLLLIWIAHRLWPQLSAWTGVGPVVGETPAFEVETLDGALVTPENLEGRVVVVNFWATWCAPCRLEMPALQELHQRYAGNGLVVLGLSTDAGGEGVVRRFLDEQGYTFPVAMADGGVRRAFGGLPGIPTTFLIDRSGTVRHRVIGLFAPPAIHAAVRRMLEEKALRAGQDRAPL